MYAVVPLGMDLSILYFKELPVKIVINYVLISLKTVFGKQCRPNPNEMPPYHFRSKKGGIDQESIQSSTTPDPGYHMGK